VQWVSLLAAVVQRNPHGDIYDMLSRPDVMRALDRRLGQARSLADGALESTWPGERVAGHLFRDSLDADIARAYSDAGVALRQAAITAFQSVPQPVNGSAASEAAAARFRAAAVRRQASAAAWHLGLRNDLTVSVARTRRQGEDVLAKAPAGMLKQWVSRDDHKVCDWCLALAKAGPIPIDQEFSYGGLVGLRRPPRVYRDLLCPPRHPRCRCRIILVGAGTPGGSRGAPAPFVPAQSVRDMSEDRYRAMRDFHAAALHELGQVLSRHREVGTE
jgi:hypothetical protein